MSDSKLITYSELQKHNKPTDAWLLIHGGVYDVTNFLLEGRHPGGDLLLEGAGRESTALFESAHPDPMVREKILGKFKIGQIDPKTCPQDDYSYDGEFYATLKKRVTAYFKDNKMGMHDHPIIYIKAITTFALYLSMYYLVYIQGNWKYIPLLGFALSQMGIQIMHDGNHGATSSNNLVSRICGHAMDLVGGSSFLWRMVHNIGHHIYTNSEMDPDTVAGYPIIRFHPETEWKWHHKYQHIYGFLAYSVVATRWLIAEWFDVFDIPEHQNIEGTKTEWFIFWSFKIVFPFYAIGVPMYFNGIGWGLAYFLAGNTVASYCFALQFAPTHINDEVVFTKTGEKMDWAEAQVRTSSNYAVGSFWATWFSGGLNYQIEHHLFPTINHPHYPALSPIVRQTCKEFDIPYVTQTSFWSGVVHHHKHLLEMGVEPTDGQPGAPMKSKTKATKVM